MNSLAEQIIVDILASEMGLSSSQIWVRDQSRKIPNDNNLYVIVGMISSEIMGVKSWMETQVIDAEEEQVEVTKVQTRDNIQIDILSRSTSALMRRWEVLTALRSIYAQQQQEENNFKICRHSNSFLNSSSAEGSSTLNRFTITVPAFVWYKKEKVLSRATDYYDSFDTRIDDEKTIGEDTGLIEFSINGWDDAKVWIDGEDWYDNGEIHGVI